MTTIIVGTTAVATNRTGVCDVGERGVCYEVYALGGRPGYSFIFASGRYDGFAPDEVAAMLTVGDVCPSIVGYQFANVQRLRADFERGRFAPAFEP